jgi:hypothetical protein
MQRVILTKHRVYELVPDAQGVLVETDFGRQALELLQKCPLAGAALPLYRPPEHCPRGPPAADQIWER